MLFPCSYCHKVLFLPVHILYFFVWLSCLICRDDVNNIKPDPEPLNLALSKLQFKDLNDCYYIGDSQKDIQSARSAGIKSIACSYGYRMDSDNPLSWGADYCINKPNEIMEIIKC